MPPRAERNVLITSLTSTLGAISQAADAPRAALVIGLECLAAVVDSDERASAADAGAAVHQRGRASLLAARSMS